WQARRRAPADAAVAAAYDAAHGRFGALFSIMLGFLAGTAVGTLAYVTTGVWGLLLPLAIMYGIFVWVSARQTRAQAGEGAWFGARCEFCGAPSYRNAAAILPPSTVVTSPVVFNSNA